MDVSIFAKQIIERLEDSIGAASTTIISGRMSSFEDYKFITGQCQGARLAQDLVSDLLKQWIAGTLGSRKMDIDSIS